MTAPGPEALRQLAVTLADGAAAIVRDAVADPHDVGRKSTSTDLVTEVDRASERWLVERLRDERPDDGVLGEEGGERSGTSGVRWVLDPIDGTVNFVLGLPAFAVSVAAEVGGRPVAGAVCDVMAAQTFSAATGGGAFLGEQRLRGPRDVLLERAVIGTGFNYDRQRRGRQGAVVAQLLTRVGDIRRVGAASLDMCAVACGRLDAYFEVGLNRWDWAAGALIAAEAGCAITGLISPEPSEAMTAVAGAHLAPEFFALLGELGAADVG